MCCEESINSQPTFHDIAHLGHVELLTPKPDESLAFFTTIVGLHEVGRRHDSVYLRAWGEYQLYSLKLTASKSSGMGHVAFRASSAESLARIVTELGTHGVTGHWVETSSRRPTFGCNPRRPSGRGLLQTDRFVPVALPLRVQNRPGAPGVSRQTVDHVNVLAADVKATREFFQHRQGLPDQPLSSTMAPGGVG